MCMHKYLHNITPFPREGRHSLQLSTILTYFFCSIHFIQGNLYVLYIAEIVLQTVMYIVCKLWYEGNLEIETKKTNKKGPGLMHF